MSWIEEERERREREEAARQQGQQQGYQQAQQVQTNRSVSTGSPWLDAAMGGGRNRGREIFYDDPDMADLRKRRIDLAEGMSGQELGAMRADARNQIQGQRSQYLRQIQSRAGRGGVGGARAAAMQGAADRGFQRNAAETERKMVLDNAALKRQGLNDLQDFYARQKMGALGTELGYGQLAAAEHSADAARSAANSGGGGLCCFIFLEARYGNGVMDRVVRRFRDENMTERNRRGYYKLAEVLVPMMRKSKLVKSLVRLTMTTPLVAYGKAYYGEGSRLGFIFKPVKDFWMKTFDFLGGDHPFIRENGETV